MRYRSRSDGGGPDYLGKTVRYNKFVPTRIDDPYNQFWISDNPNLNSQSVKIERIHDELHSGPPFKSGGPLSKWTIVDGLDASENATANLLVKDTSRDWSEYTGRFVCAQPAKDCSYMVPEMNNNFHNLGYLYPETSTSFGDIADYGPKAWDRYAPGQSIADLAVFVAEISDLPRMLKKTAFGLLTAWKSVRSQSGKRMAKEAAEHHLNTQFGWLPFVRDVQKLMALTNDIDKHLNQIRRDNNQWVKRSGSVDVTADEWDIVQENNMSLHYPNFGNSGVPGSAHRIIRVLNQRVWFSGRFRYYIPETKIATPRWRKKVTRQLYGLELTPEVIWNIIPWSWLLDWFSEISSLLGQRDDGWAENLVAKYAYVMGTTKVALRIQSWLALPANIHEARFEHSLERKERVTAGRFGFQSTPTELTGRQSSILTALGVSRLK